MTVRLRLMVLATRKLSVIVVVDVDLSVVVDVSVVSRWVGAFVTLIDVWHASSMSNVFAVTNVEIAQGYSITEYTTGF